MGLSLEDFCRCTPAEFLAIANAYNEQRDLVLQQQWEQTRMQCLCLLQPYSKTKLKPTDIFSFPWDPQPAKQQQLSTEEIKQRYQQALLRFNQKK